MHLRLHRVGLGGDGVLAPAWQRPDEGAGFGLLEAPAWCLLGLVMPAAERVHVTFAGPAALVVRDGVIVVTVDRRSAAAGESTASAADLDHVPQGVGGLV